MERFQKGKRVRGSVSALGAYRSSIANECSAFE